MTETCAPRQPNEALRAVRESMHLSRREFAALIRKTGEQLGEPNGCTPRLIQRWETGEYATCRPHYRRALQAATQTPYNRLGFHGAWNELPHNTPPTGTDSAMPGHPGEHFRYALAAPIQATDEAANLAQSTVAQLFDLDQHTPARILLPTVNSHLDDIATLLCGTRDGAVRQRLITTGGQAAALAGRLALDCDQSATAHRYWDSAMAAARDAADAPLLACVLMYLSDAALQRGDHNAAWQLAHSAAEHATDEPRTRAWIAVQAARAAARRGDSAAALAELKLAHDWELEIGPPAAPDDTAPSWARFVDHAYLWAMAAHVHTVIGDADNAHHAAVRAIDTLNTSYVKTRAIILAEAAYTFACLGGTQRAMHHATDALTVIETLHVPAAAQRLRKMIELLPNPLDTTGRELRQRLEHART